MINNAGILNHPLVENLFILTLDGIEIYFEYVGYDSSEMELVFERNDEVVTAKLQVNCESQLKVWRDAFDNMGIELEYY